MSLNALRYFFSQIRTNRQEKKNFAATDLEDNISEREPLLRRKIESSKTLKFAKLITNQGLNWLGLGATIVSLLRKKNN